jgi:hypothetical protein
MKNPNEDRNALIAGVITAILLIWLIMASSCAPRKPLYGPHRPITKTAREWDIERRNAFDDGYYVREKIGRNYGESTR